MKKNMIVNLKSCYKKKIGKSSVKVVTFTFCIYVCVLLHGLFSSVLYDLIFSLHYKKIDKDETESMKYVAGLSVD